LRSYNYGIRKFIDVSLWAKEMGVQTISVWALSVDNIKNRNKIELNTLYGLYIKASNDPDILKKLKNNEARIRIIGNLNLLPKKLREALKRLEARTKAYGKFSINILVGYGGREDIIHAVRKIAADKKNKLKLNYETIKKNLVTAILPDADLIIRTSGEMRLSGFLPLQGSYSELYFSKKYWPSFTKEDLTKAIATFSKRNRRFGK
jgi:undecaprenyl diphosphate synthase